MKQIILIVFAYLSISTSYAQSIPSGIAYQAVAIKDGTFSLGGQNSSSMNWSMKDIQVKFSILEKFPNGTIQYSEIHKTKTDEYGVFNLIIGQGQVLSGVFDNIPWDLGTAHLQVEIDFDNNNTFKITSFERFWSVPYAFNTRKSKILNYNTDSVFNVLNTKINYLKNRDKDTIIGNEGVSYKSLDSLNQVLKTELFTIKRSLKDTVVGNEIQQLTMNKDTILLSLNGGNIVLKDNNPSNELQNLSLSGDSLLISNGKGVKINKQNSFSDIKSYYHSSISIAASLKSTGSPYGWVYEINSKVDTFSLKKGDRLVIYSTSVGLINGLIGGWKVVDATGAAQNAFMITHESSTSGSSAQGMSYADWSNNSVSSNPSRICEIHFTAPQNGIYYLNIISQIFTSPGVNSASINSGSWYVEIN